MRKEKSGHIVKIIALDMNIIRCTFRNNASGRGILFNTHPCPPIILCWATNATTRIAVIIAEKTFYVHKIVPNEGLLSIQLINFPN